MSEPFKQSSLRFQLLILGTILFLVAFFSLAIPKSAPSGELI